MMPRAIHHGTFAVERTYSASRARVFRAFSDSDIKRRWYVDGEGWRIDTYTADFRVAGVEFSRYRFRDGPPITNDTRYLDIVGDTRIVFSYVVTIDDTPASVSLASVELFDADAGTRLLYTEQGQYFEGADQALERELGCGILFDTLGEELRSHP